MDLTLLFSYHSHAITSQSAVSGRSPTPGKSLAAGGGGGGAVSGRLGGLQATTTAAGSRRMSKDQQSMPSITEEEKEVRYDWIVVKPDGEKVSYETILHLK